MKKFFSFLLLLGYMVAQAQIQDLAKMSSGKLVEFAPIYKSEKLDEMASVNKIWGYYAIYQLDAIESDKYKMEYVLLDKNLNKFANGEFVGYYVRALGKTFPMNYSIYLEEKTNIAVLSGSYGYYSYTYCYDIDLKNNTLSKPYVYDDGKKKPIEINSLRKLVTKEYREDIKNLKSKADEKYYETVDSTGYMVYNFKRNNQKRQYLDELSYYNTKDSSLVWTKKMNELAAEKDKKEREIYFYNFLNSNDNTIIFTKTIERNDIKIKLDGYQKINHKLYGITCLDRKTGNVIYDNDIFKDKTIIYTSIVGGKIIKGEKYVFIYEGINKDNELEGYNFNLIDLKEGKITKENTFSFKDVNSPDLKFRGNGNKLEGGYELIMKDYSVYQDGRVMMLLEKMKFGVGYLSNQVNVKSTDLVMANFDANFVFKGINIFNKEYSKERAFGGDKDYLFSQYIDNGNGDALFYKDKVKDQDTKSKEWKLGIITVRGGEVKKEELPMSAKDEFLIEPFPAKEGYILLREYNEKDKYNQIRLEKLNF